MSDPAAFLQGFRPAKPPMRRGGHTRVLTLRLTLGLPLPPLPALPEQARAAAAQDPYAFSDAPLDCGDDPELLDPELLDPESWDPEAAEAVVDHWIKTQYPHLFVPEAGA